MASGTLLWVEGFPCGRPQLFLQPVTRQPRNAFWSQTEPRPVPFLARKAQAGAPGGVRGCGKAGSMSSLKCVAAGKRLRFAAGRAFRGLQATFLCREKEEVRTLRGHGFHPLLHQEAWKAPLALPSKGTLFSILPASGSTTDHFPDVVFEAQVPPLPLPGRPFCVCWSLERVLPFEECLPTAFLSHALPSGGIQPATIMH